MNDPVDCPTYEQYVCMNRILFISDNEYTNTNNTMHSKPILSMIWQYFGHVSKHWHVRVRGHSHIMRSS